MNTDRKISFAFLAAFALLALVPMFVFENRGRLITDSNWVTHTQEVIANIESSLQALTEAESSARGYALTGRTEHLDVFAKACDRVSASQADLLTLTLDNSAQQQRLEALKPLVRSRVHRLEQFIERRKASRTVTPEMIALSEEGRKLMDQIRGVADEMRSDEKHLLEARREKLHASVGNGMKVFWFVTVLNFLTLAFSFYLVNRYITHRRRAETKLSEAKQAAEAANVAKSAFLANMSHEIRTPMSAIVGYSDMLLEPGSTQSDKLDCLQTIRRNARHLLELINDVLDLSKIEAGRMTVENLPTDLPQLTSDVVSMMRPRAIEKGLMFRLNFVGAVPRQVRTDPLRMKQILVNLVGNAIKFTETGGVELRVSCARDTKTGGNAVVTFDVVDSGIGISNQQIERLFQPFSQADESTTRKFGGTGLGLTISQRLARMLGGAITARSEPLRGSTFTVTIDAGTVADHELVTGLTESLAAAELAAPAITASAAEPAKLNVRILLAEDGIDNQRLISTYLRGAGAEVVIADNGRCAVDLAMSQHFHLIVMDMQMPLMDGYAAAGELRRRGMKLPIIALTAHAMADDRAKCLDAGCTDYLTKPIARRDLVDAVRRHVPADTSTLRSTFADEDDMREIIAQFVAGLSEQVRELEATLGSGDKAALKRQLHQIKGSAGGYGFQPITEAAARAEKRVVDNAGEAEIAKGVRELIGLVSTVDGFVPTLDQKDPGAREAA